MKIYALILLLLLTACNETKNNKEAGKVVVKPVQKQEITGSNSYGYLKLVGDSLEIPEFAIHITLSKLAKEKLADIKEDVKVIAYFDGLAKKDVPKEYLDDLDVGRLQLCTATREISTDGTVVFKQVKFPEKMYKVLADKDISLLINIVSARKSDPDNLLDGDILTQKMSVVKGKTYKINVKLNSEPGDSGSLH